MEINSHITNPKDRELLTRSAFWGKTSLGSRASWRRNQRMKQERQEEENEKKNNGEEDKKSNGSSSELILATLRMFVQLRGVHPDPVQWPHETWPNACPQCHHLGTGPQWSPCCPNCAGVEFHFEYSILTIRKVDCGIHSWVFHCYFRRHKA